jgi:hypothetical protein
MILYKKGVSWKKWNKLNLHCLVNNYQRFLSVSKIHHVERILLQMMLPAILCRSLQPLCRCVCWGLHCGPGIGQLFFFINDWCSVYIIKKITCHYRCWRVFFPVRSCRSSAGSTVCFPRCMNVESFSRSRLRLVGSRVVSSVFEWKASRNGLGCRMCVMLELHSIY